LVTGSCLAMQGYFDAGYWFAMMVDNTDHNLEANSCELLGAAGAASTSTAGASHYEVVRRALGQVCGIKCDTMVGCQVAALIC